MVLKPERSKEREEIKQSHESGKEAVKEHGSNDESKDKPADAEKQIKDTKEEASTNKEDKSQNSPKRAAPDVEKGTHGGEGEERVNVEKQDLLRFIILGRKVLPDVSRRTRPYWCFVDLVTTKIEQIKAALGPEEYGTKTRGERHLPAARAAGEGIYCILQHKRNRQPHTHLIYRLELPKSGKPHDPQEELQIKEEGSFIIQVKNPNQPAPPNIGLGNKRKATYPAYLQSNMGHYRFVAADPCDYLNFEGCEFILISASDDVEKELGVHLDVEHDEECSVLLSTLGRKAPLNVKPVLEGKWA
ncbi:hypothetical protein KP509_21G057300 [Ceratopteris richardii]|nr:hypothetical protein KP509_21G057300 [Ceratopteris richardii]